uniref:Uncharacterized protein n=1 Tax=Bursaphelenchus xylophilus TaxID=6326 RepID=A0A1I7SE51_BURXY
MKLRFISSSLLSPFRHKIILSMEDPNGTLPTTTAAKFVEDFYHKHASKLSVYDLKARINLCISDCLNGGKCKATTTNKRNIYRNFDFVVHVRNVVWK